MYHRKVHCLYQLLLQVSIFLKTGAQLRDGRFVIPSGGSVPHGFEPPGIIRWVACFFPPALSSPAPQFSLLHVQLTLVCLASCNLLHFVLSVLPALCTMAMYHCGRWYMHLVSTLSTSYYGNGVFFRIVCRLCRFESLITLLSFLPPPLPLSSLLSHFPPPSPPTHTHTYTPFLFPSLSHLPFSPSSPHSHARIPTRCAYYRYYDDHGDCTIEKFSPPHKHGPAEPLGSFEVKGNRVISLGCNM